MISDFACGTQGQMSQQWAVESCGKWGIRAVDSPMGEGIISWE
jgi:hypothetical protein